MIRLNFIRKPSILCGDFFGLTPNALGRIDAVYDRAALTALPEPVRKRYVAHMRHILPPNCSIFLLTLEDACRKDGHTCNIGEVDDEIWALYGDHFIIQSAHTEADSKSDLICSEDSETAVIHKAYRMVPKA